MIEIREGELDLAVQLSQQIPEFSDPYPKQIYLERLKNNASLILTAYFNNEYAGFKIGYSLDNSVFYSWMGGVLPNLRRSGIGYELANYQENWAIKNGYQKIRLKTRKKHQAMIQFSLKRQFEIIEEIPRIPEEETRLIMEKNL